MTRSLGPLDKRKRLTRCQPCATRRIKCRGGSPCDYCIRTDKSCEPQQPAANAVQFINVTAPSQGCRQPTRLPPKVPKHNDLLFRDYFVTFISVCQFTPSFASIQSDLLPLIETSPTLRHLAMAIGAKEAGRRGAISTYSGNSHPQNIAFSCYSKSLRLLQQRLESPDVLGCEDILWSTFLLGLFELISEPTGDQWAKHMFYGTSRIIQLLGPVESLSTLPKSLFEAFSILEASRAILYGVETFLSQDIWLEYQHRLAGEPFIRDETVLELMLCISLFSSQFFKHIEAIPESLRCSHPEIDRLTHEGIHMWQRLKSWKGRFGPDIDQTDPHLQLAMTNYHALELFVCKTFTYYSCWDDKTIPQLPQADIDSHVATIIDISETMLQSSNIPGVLMLFPLRMAGANAVNNLQKAKVSRILRRIYQKGFVVSERIIEDLRQLWQFQESQICRTQQID